MPRRSAAVAANTRETILEAAFAAFAERGFAGATTADVARAAGVTEGALFHHFAGKKALFRAVVERLQRRFHQAVEMSGEGAPDAAAAIRAGMTAALELSQAPAYRRIVLIEAPAILGDADWRGLDSGLGLAVIEPALRSLARPGKPPPPAIQIMSIFVLGALNEAAFALARGGEAGFSIQACVDEVMRLLADWAGRQWPR